MARNLGRTPCKGGCGDAAEACNGKGAPEALTSAEVTQAYRGKIYHYILRLVRDPDEAEDLTQETFLRVHRKLETLLDPNTVSTWVYRIATNVCYDRFRQPAYRNRAQTVPPAGDDSEAAWEDVDIPGLDEIIDRADMGHCVREFIEALSDSYRTVILLHDLNGMTNPEIAEALGCSLATIKIRLHRARLRLKESLERGCDFSHDERGALVCEPKTPSE